MIQPFHLSFVVPDIESVKAFYLDILKCDLGRDTGNWFDILFFGHQITIHKERDGLVSKSIDHFGPILDKDRWEEVSNNLKVGGVKFVLEPIIKNTGEHNESGKYIVLDPAGNSIEFKYYKDREVEFQAQNV